MYDIYSIYKIFASEHPTGNVYFVIYYKVNRSTYRDDGCDNISQFE